ncbi:hypothetical protein AAH111_13585, partial [Bacteroides thetaiotaomicron]
GFAISRTGEGGAGYKFIIPCKRNYIAFEGLPPLFNSFMLIAETPKDYIRCMECLNLNIDERIKTKEMFIKTYQSDSITNYIKRI